MTSYRKRLRRTALLLFLLSAPAWAQAEPGDAVVGDWLVKTGDAVIHIDRSGDGYDGHIVWQLRNRYGPEDGPTLDGKLVVDRNNPDPAQRSRTLDGLRLMWDLRYDAERQEWTGGRVYDAEDGHTYRCLLRLIDADHLKLRGYFGISLIGGSSIWTRVRNFSPGTFPPQAPKPQQLPAGRPLAPSNS
jgi:uncharacterized protein (DUF2147 family)